MNRRTFLRRGGVLAAGTLLYGTTIEPQWTEYVHRSLPIEHLPPALMGKTLLQISDTHVGERVSSRFLRTEFRRSAALDPDFVVYTGDHVDRGTDKQLAEFARLLEVAPRGRLGTVAILGNHDYGHKFRDGGAAERVAERLRAAGITVLRNEQTTVAGLTITGLDDRWGTNYAPGPALAATDPAAANLVLCHNPDACDDGAELWGGYRGWILAGHTHGGQCRLPGFGPPILPVRNPAYAAGRVDLGDGRLLYVNRALGHSHRIRFGVRPEVTVFTLA